MKIYIDADGCPVVDETVLLAQKHKIDCVILCDTSHVFNKSGATTITVSKGADSVDFALVNMISPNDIVVIQDYGLAAIVPRAICKMALRKRAITISQDGMIYNNDNIDALLLARHTAKKIRNSGGRLRGSTKRTQKQDSEFGHTLENLLIGDSK